jgi:hypothetical protein
MTKITNAVLFGTLLIISFGYFFLTTDKKLEGDMATPPIKSQTFHSEIESKTFVTNFETNAVNTNSVSSDSKDRVFGWFVVSEKDYEYISNKAKKNTTPFAYKKYWIENINVNTGGNVEFEIYHTFGFSPNELQKMELAFYYEVDRLFDDNLYGESSLENEEKIQVVLEDMNDIKTSSIVCAKHKCMFVIETDYSNSFDPAVLVENVISNIKIDKNCDYYRKLGSLNRQFFSIYCPP